MTNHSWAHIKPLSDDDKKMDLAAIRPLYDSWYAIRDRIRSENDKTLNEFSQKLVRRLSIETGILERVYELDRGTTEALITHGFAVELVTHSSTNIEPANLIDILKDHESAIQLMMDCVSSNRSLSKQVIHELHSILVKNQDYTLAQDQFGNRHQIPLLKGKYKEQPNNPKRSDGTVHEYCPPIHVDSEMDQLLRWLEEYKDEDPIIVGSWFHHRFTQIHPYQDGNGRVGRALTTLVLLRANLLPFVIDRDLRVEYLDALELADQGDLFPVTKMFARLERTAILQALSVDSDLEVQYDRSISSAVLDNIANKLDKRRQKKFAELRKVNELSIKLRNRAKDLIEPKIGTLRKILGPNQSTDVHHMVGGPQSGNSHWYKFEVVKFGRSAGNFINFEEDHYFIKSSIRFQNERLVFVVSFHHIGKEITGIVEATAFSYLESFESAEHEEPSSNEYFPCSLEPFVLTWKTKFEDTLQSFDSWLDTALAVAFKEYGDRI